MTSLARRSARKAPVATAEPTPEPQPEWDLRRYVLGECPQSVAALGNLIKLCEKHLSGRYRIEVIDLLQTPRLARDHQIVAVPTLVRQLPAPVRKIVGDLSDTARTLVGLELRPAAPTGAKWT
jgi:circadian clock protein KaiB